MMEAVERCDIYDWILVVYVHEIPYYVNQSDAIVRCIVEAPVRGRVAVFVIREAVRQVMEPLPEGDGQPGGVADPGRLAPVNYYRLTVSELQFDERGVAGFVEVSGRYEGKDGWRHALRATFPRVKARRRMLVSFSHGAAFGINVDMEGLMRGKISMVWTTDLAAELKHCLGGQPIDVLLLNNCYMQCFETGCALRDQVRFIVAAEGALGAIGFDYAGLMRRLLGQPGDDNEALVKGIIGDYAAVISRSEQAGQAVFANRADEYGNAMVLLERVTAILVERMDEVIDVLVDIRENKLLYVSAPLNGYTSNYLCMIDLFAWVSMVFDRLGDLLGGTGLAAEFAALRRRLVVAGEVGEGLVEHDAGWPAADAKPGADVQLGGDGQRGAMGTPIYGYSGLSIFYPRSADLTLLRAIPRCATLVASWRCFLDIYYTRALRGARA